VCSSKMIHLVLNAETFEALNICCEGVLVGSNCSVGTQHCHRRSLGNVGELWGRTSVALVPCRATKLSADDVILGLLGVHCLSQRDAGSVWSTLSIAT
jgi:hypothetical protein